MLSSLGHIHYIKSNRESGRGRYDVLIIPKQGTKSILLEFKHIRKEEELEEKANEALTQIQTQVYRTELQHYSHIQEVVEVGIAFSKKYVQAAYATYDLTQHIPHPTEFTCRYDKDYTF